MVRILVKSWNSLFINSYRLRSLSHTLADISTDLETRDRNCIYIDERSPSRWQLIEPLLQRDASERYLGSKFEFWCCSLRVFYADHGVVGETRIGGRREAHKTVRLTGIVAEIGSFRLLNTRGLDSDLRSGFLELTSVSEARGRIKVEKLESWCDELYHETQFERTVYSKFVM